MSKYRCKICGYKGKRFIFTIDDYSYCLASNIEEPEYLGEAPTWVKNKGVGEAKIVAQNVILGEVINSKSSSGLM